MQDTIKQLIEIREKQVRFFDAVRLLVILMGLVALCLWADQSDWYSWLAVVIVIVVVVAILVNKSYAKKFNKMFNDEWIGRGVSDLLDRVSYIHDIVYNNKNMEESQLFEMADYSINREQLRGEYMGVSIEAVGVHAECIHNEGKAKYFSGRILKLENPQVMTGSVRLYTHHFPWRKPSVNGIYKMESEDIDFNQIFEVEASNPEDVQYMLTPKFVECMKKLSQQHENIAVNFIDGYLYIALTPNKKTQPQSMLHKEYYEEALARIRTEAQVMTEIIDAISA